MDVFNKFYSSVQTTVSQLSSVLPGIHLSGHEILEVIGSCGIGSCWKIYNGIKKTTKENVSVFVFEKKFLERLNKDEREIFLNLLKKSIQQSTKIRHPQFLEIRQPLEENRDCLSFATEPIFMSLSECITNNNEKLSDLEIKYGLLQLVEGLNFLHSDMKIVHCNLTPNNILINQNGKWKIFGFEFFIQGQNKDGALEWPYNGFNPKLNILLQPPLEFSAPETALNSSITTDSDLYLLGALIYTFFNKGKPMKMFMGKYDSFTKFCKEINLGKFPNLDCIPLELRDSLKSLMHSSPLLRIKLHEFRNCQFFNDTEVKSLAHLDSLYQLDNLEKSKFLKNVGDIINSYPLRVNLQIVLPNLVKEYINPQMIPFVLQNVFIIAKKCDPEKYQKNIFPHLIPVMKINDPIQIFLVILQNMDLILSSSTKEDIKNHVVPMLYKALDSKNSQLQEMCLKVLPEISSLIESSAMKSILLPKIQSLCMNSSNLSVKVNALICIGHLLDNLDRWLVSDIILPFLIKIPNREPAVVMAIIGIIKLTMSNKKLGLTKSEMATKVLPFLIPLSIENSLSMHEFNTIMILVKDLISKVENEQRTKIEQSINNTTIPTSIPDPTQELERTQKVNSLSSFSLDNSNQKKIEKEMMDNKSSTLSSDFENHFQITPKNNIVTSPVNHTNQNILTMDVLKDNYISLPNPFDNKNSNVKPNIGQMYNGINTTTIPRSEIKTSNFESLRELDPFANNSQKTPMNQIRPALSQNNNFNVLQPKSTSSIVNSNLNQLSQQDILDFLN